MALDLNFDGTPVFVAGDYGKALRASVGTIQGNPFAGQTQVTIEWTGRAGDTTSEQYIYGGVGSATLRISSEGKAEATIYVPGTHVFTSNVLIDDTNRHTLALTLDTVAGAGFWVDGVLVDSRAGSLTFTDNPVSIGNQYGYGGNFQGDTDEFAITSGIKYTSTYTPGPVLNNQANLIAVYHFQDNGLNSAGLAQGDSIPPTASSAAVANGTPSVVAITMSEAMDAAFTPAASTFTVSGHTVTSVSISGSVVNLTCSSAFVYSEAARTVSYTQNGTNNLRDVAGNPLANFSSLAITNNVSAAGDTTPPSFVSAQVTNSQPAVILLTMSETLAASVPPNSAFTASGGRTVTGVSVTGSVVSITVNTPYVFGDTITIAYTQPGTNPRLQDAATTPNLTATFGAQSVTNNVAFVPAALSRFNGSLGSVLDVCNTKEDWCTAFINALGSNRRLTCSRNGSVFLDIALTGAVTKVGGNIASFGKTSTASSQLAADLSTGTCTLRIEGNGNYVQGTLGLAGSNTDFQMDASPTTGVVTGFALVNMGLKAPVALSSGTGYLAPTLTANAPATIEIEDWTSGAKGAVLSTPIDAQRLNWVFDHPYVAAGMGDVAIFQTSTPIVFGGFEFGATLFAMSGQANSQGSEPVYQVLIGWKPTSANWNNYPFFDGYVEGSTDTFAPPFKAVIRKANGAILKTHEMRDGLPINSDLLHDNHLSQTTPDDQYNNADAYAFPIRPHMHCAGMLPWQSARPKMNPNLKNVMPGFSLSSLRPKVSRTHFTTNQTLPMFNGRDSINGVSNFYTSPKWAAALGNPANFEPNNDPYTYDMTANPLVNLTGWGYEPGSFGIQDTLTAPGGSRHDRIPVPTPLAVRFTKADYVRPRDGATIEEMADAWNLNMFNFPMHFIRNAATFETLSLQIVDQGGLATSKGYYNELAYYGSPATSVPQFANGQNFTNQHYKAYKGAFVDKNSRLPYGGCAFDILHNYNNPAWTAFAYNSPMHAYAALLRQVMSHMLHPSNNGSNSPAGAQHPFNGQLYGSSFLIRDQGWSLMNLSLSYLLGSSHPQFGILTQMTVDRIVREWEAIYDYAYVPTMVEQRTTIYYKTLRNLGIPLGSDGSFSSWHADSRSALSYYLTSDFLLLRQTGLLDIILNKSEKCKQAFLFMIRCLDLGAVDYILDTDGREEPLDGFNVTKGPNVQNANGYDSWADWAVSNPKGHPDQDWITAIDGRKRPLWGYPWDQDIAQHMRYQYVCFRRDYLPEVPCERTNGIALAIAKYKGWYDYVAAAADAGGQDWTWLFPGLTPINLPETLAPLTALA
jgi:hypothetical protein